MNLKKLVSVLLATCVLATVSFGASEKLAAAGTKAIKANNQYQITAKGHTYYIKDRILYSKDSQGKTTQLLALDKSYDSFYDLNYMYGNNLYITRGSEEKWTYWTYIYNVVTKKYKLVASNCALSFSNGSYVVAGNEYRTDVSAFKTSLYKFTSTGLKKIKVLSKHGFSGAFIKGKLYYTSSPSNAMRKVTLYRCNPNGSGKKALGTFANKKKYGQVIMSKITSKYCIYTDYNGWYKYTYKTKKTKKTKSPY